MDQQQSVFYIQAAGTVTTHQPASCVFQDPHIYHLEAAWRVDEADRYILLEILPTAAFLNSASSSLFHGWSVLHAKCVCLTH